MKGRIALKSILFKIMIPMLLFLVFQTAIILAVYFESGIIPTARQDAFNAFNDKVINRKNYLEADFNGRYFQLDNYLEIITEDIEVVLKESGQTIENITHDKFDDKFLTRSFSTLTQIIKNNGVNGAFIALKLSTEASQEINSLYLRCESPKAVTDASLYLNIASAVVGGKIGDMVTLDGNLERKLKIEGADYFCKPYNAVKNELSSEGGVLPSNVTPSHYAYFSESHLVVKNGRMVVSYSVPLIYKGVLLGVWGVDLSVSTLEGSMPSTELSEDYNGAYALCRSKSNSYTPIAINGAHYIYLFGDESTFSTAFTGKSNNLNNFEVYPTSGRKKAKHSFGYVEEINVYESNSHFGQDKIYLVAMLDGHTLLSFTATSTKIISISVLSTAVIGIIIVVAVAFVITKPIRKLPERVREFSTPSSGSLLRTGTKEVDLLIDSIEDLRTTVFNNSNKLSKIVELSGMPLGAYEINKLEDTVSFTGKIAEILDRSDFVTGKISCWEFKAYLKQLEKLITEDSGKEKTYSFITAAGKQRYVSINTTMDNRQTTGVVLDVTEDRMQRSRIEYERDYDLLTGLLNRRAFFTRAKKLFLTPEQIGQAALIMLDMDNLKVLNDTYGHEQGDEYLKTMAKALKTFLPEREIILSRQSGDEFVVLVYGYDDKGSVRREITRLKELIASGQVVMPGDQKVKLRCSMGASFYPDDSKTLDDLMRFSDFAMYEVKQKNKGDLYEFSPKTYEARDFNNHTYERLNNLIEKNLVDYNFQPIISLKTAKVYAYEALMRSKDEIFTNPMQIIALARTQHKLYHIERMTWLNATRIFYKYKDKVPNAKLFINSIPSHVLALEDVKQIEATCTDILSRVVVEFTEDEKINEDFVKIKKHIIARWGGKIALDDFGTGYSNDTVLLMLNPDYIKVDMFIIRGIDSNASKRKLLENIVSYAVERKIQIIAEGVETRAELKTVIACGVHYVQGFYLAKPSEVPAELADDKRIELLSIIKSHGGKQENSEVAN